MASLTQASNSRQTTQFCAILRYCYTDNIEAPHEPHNLCQCKDQATCVQPDLDQVFLLGF